MAGVFNIVENGVCSMWRFQLLVVFILCDCDFSMWSCCDFSWIWIFFYSGWFRISIKYNVWYTLAPYV